MYLTKKVNELRVNELRVNELGVNELRVEPAPKSSFYWLSNKNSNRIKCNVLIFKNKNVIENHSY